MRNDKSAWPDVDERIHAVGVAKLRQMNTDTLRNLGDHLYIVRDGEEPLAVVVGYKEYLELQRRADTEERTAHD